MRRRAGCLTPLDASFGFGHSASIRSTMAQVLIRAAAVFRRIPVALTWLLLAGGGAALVLLPLFGLPGYELSAALALGHGLLGGVTGIASARLERRLIRSVEPRPKNAARFDSALRSSSCWSTSHSRCKSLRSSRPRWRTIRSDPPWVSRIA